MQKKHTLFHKLAGPLAVILLISSFFIPKLISGKIPYPADDLLQLYHPWRDVSFDGYVEGKFPAKNTLITDPVLQTYPWKYLVVKNGTSALMPLWNPYSFSGQPLLANIQSSPFSIFNTLFFIFPFNIAWALLVILPMVLSGIFMYLFLRSLHLSKTSSTFGGMILPFTGFFISWFTWGTIITTAMWLPLILFAQNKLFEKITVRWFLILVLAASQTVFSGHWQSALYIFLAAFLYLILRGIQSKKHKKTILSLLSIVLGILIASVQIIPSIELIQHSSRAIDQGYTNNRQDWFLPLGHLVQLVAPDFFGNPTTNNYWGVWNYGEFVSFIGIVPLGFAILAITKRKFSVQFFTVLAGVALILALPNPISKIPYLLNLPFISSLQPSRILFLLVFCLSVLSAFGFEYFFKEKNKVKNVLPILTPLVLAVLVIAYAYVLRDTFPQVNNLNAANIAFRNSIFPLATAAIFTIITFISFFKVKKELVICLVFTLTVVELFRFGYKFAPFSKLSWIFPQTETTRFLEKQQKPFRIVTTDRRILHPNVTSIYGIESIDGYDPLYLEQYGQFISSLLSNSPKRESAQFNRIVTPQKYESNLINLLNVKYVATFDEIKNENFIKVLQEGETKLYENKNVLPRATFVEEVVKVSSDQEELSQLLDLSFEPSNRATSQEISFQRQNGQKDATIEKYEDQSLTIKTKSQTDAPLLVTNVFYPGWRAWIDNEETQIHKADFMFQLIVVPKGEHTVRLKYQPKSFELGMYGTGGATVATILIATYIWKRKYQ